MNVLLHDAIEGNHADGGFGRHRVGVDFREGGVKVRGGEHGLPAVLKQPCGDGTELIEVPRPSLLRGAREEGGVQLGLRKREARGFRLDQMAGEQRDVVGAFAQSRKREAQGAELSGELGAEGAGADEGAEVARG